MTEKTTPQFVSRRGELLAELFLQELKPRFVARTASDAYGVDFFAGFPNGRGGVNLIAIEVKATEDLPQPRFRLKRSLYLFLANSNVPGLILIVDVKQGRYYYALADATDVAQKEVVSFDLTEADEVGREGLVRLLSR